jgi:serine/threonine protein kinase
LAADDPRAEGDAVSAFAGTTLAGKYVVESELGVGSMGRVLRARDVALGRTVAIKLVHRHLLSRSSVVRRFEREAKLASSLQSKNAMQVMAIEWLPSGEPFIVMELLEGKNLALLLEERGRFPIPTAARYVIDACNAVSEAHAKGIIHRDLKPANMLLASTPDGPTIKVLDFGLAKLFQEDGNAEESAITRGSILGSPTFMSPEQIEGKKDIDHRTDIWSLGVTLQYLVVGAPPFDATSLTALLARIRRAEAVPLSAVCKEATPALAEVIRRCLARDREDRFPDVDSFVSALERATTAGTAPMRLIQPTPGPDKTTRLPLLSAPVSTSVPASIPAPVSTSMPASMPPSSGPVLPPRSVPPNAMTHASSGMMPARPPTSPVIALVIAALVVVAFVGVVAFVVITRTR